MQGYISLMAVTSIYQGMQSRCPTADVVGTATLKDYQLLFRDGLATVEPKPGAEVPVLVWDIQLWG